MSMAEERKCSMPILQFVLTEHDFKDFFNVVYNYILLNVTYFNDSVNT